MTEHLFYDLNKNIVIISTLKHGEFILLHNSLNQFDSPLNDILQVNCHLVCLLHY